MRAFDDEDDEDEDDLYDAVAKFRERHERSFGGRLMKFRDDCELTQRKAAERCGVAESQWSRWETREEPSLESMRRIARAFGLSNEYVGWLVTGGERSRASLDPAVRERLRCAQDELASVLDSDDVVEQVEVEG